MRLDFYTAANTWPRRAIRRRAVRQRRISAPGVGLSKRVHPTQRRKGRILAVAVDQSARSLGGDLTNVREAYVAGRKNAKVAAVLGRHREEELKILPIRKRVLDGRPQVVDPQG